MKKIIRNKSFLVFFIATISFGLFYGCVSKGVRGDSSGIKIRGGAERLVASKYSRSGDGFFTFKWCGNAALIFRSERFKVGIIDIKTGKRIPLNLTLSDSKLNCTSDGKKLFYVDAASRRDDGERSKRIDIKPSPGIFPWSNGSVKDMYLYDIETHEKTFIASVYELGSDEILSPDGKKILFGNRHRLASKNGGPDEWKTVWFAREKNQSRAIWFPDSSGVISSGKGASNILCVEFFGEDGWDRCFKQKDDMLKLRVDREGGIYYLGGHPLAGQHFLNQCVIKDMNVTCKRILEHYDVFRNFDFLPGGDVIFEDNSNDLCVHRSTSEGKVDECVIGVRYGDRLYDGVSVVGVSPDGRWLAFRRDHTIMIQGKKRPYWGMDLFVMELKDK